jgi:Zn/Cd-binding protein ZinT
MTMKKLEKHSKYIYHEWVEYVSKAFEHVQTFTYKGFDIITYSSKGKGMHYKMFSNLILIRERDYIFCPDFSNHIRRYIDTIKK